MDEYTVMGEYTLPDALSELSTDVYQLKLSISLLSDVIAKLVEVMQNRAEQNS